MTTLGSPTGSDTMIGLLATLRDRGVRVAAQGDQLSVDAPQGVLTPELLERITVRKPAILTLMSGDCDPLAWRLWHLALDRLEGSGQLPDDVLATCRRATVCWIETSSSEETWAAPPTGPACAGCGSTEFRDVAIHGGRSLRRDCGGCGRFIDFVQWNPPSD